MNGEDAPSGGTWRRQLSDADGAFDEVHWCSGGPDAEDGEGWRELWRVMAPGGLLQVRRAVAALRPATSVVEASLGRGAQSVELFKPLELEAVAGALLADDHASDEVEDEYVALCRVQEQVA